RTAGQPFVHPDYEHLENPRGIYLQNYNSAGVPIGEVYTPTAPEHGANWYPAVTALGNGGFLLTYEKGGSGSEKVLNVHGFSENGAEVVPRFMLGAEAEVFPYLNDGRGHVELSDQTVVVAWTVNTYDRGPDDDDWNDRAWI
ncbi:hypothetical protein, partial [Limnospira sp. PMC 1252.20]|uniref:hypothetical protein n=1 Tax=Limnospira sp. PMC 1252.20 TaxID=2981050 RepID=UPI0028E108D9